MFKHMTASLISAIQQSFDGILSLRTTADEKCLPSLLSDWIEVDEIDQIPRNLLLWIQSQDGLKIDRNPISSTDDLLLAYQLLSPLKQESRQLSLIEMSIKVATWYLSKAKKHRWNSVQSLIFPAVSPYNIMRRKCFRCGERVLDDPLACFAVADATKYVTWYRSGGCGRPECQVLGNAELVPASAFQEYRMARQETLQCLRSADWKDYLLISPLETLGYLPQTVETCCSKCQARWLDMRPRWTTEKSSRYVKRVRKCTKCSEQSSFAPKDPTITSMAQSYCSKRWGQLKKAGVDPAAYQYRLELLWSEAPKKTKSGPYNAIPSDCDQPQKRRRIFNSKSRANRDRKENGAGS